MRLQIRVVIHVVQHLAHKTVTAAGELQESLQQTFEGAALFLGFDEHRLRPAHRFQHALLAINPMRSQSHSCHVRREAVPDHRPIGFALGHRFRAVPALACLGQHHPVSLSPHRQLPRRALERGNHLGLVVGMNPIKQDPRIFLQVLGLDFKHFPSDVIHVRDHAAAVCAQPRLVHHPRHAGRDGLEELELLGETLGGFALRGDVLHHAEIGLGIARHGGLPYACAKPAQHTIGSLPAELHLTPVHGGTGDEPGGLVVGVDARAPLHALDAFCWLEP